jgi:hypothetical protein
VKQKKAIYVTLTLFVLTIIENQLIWYGWAPIFQGYGGLILSGGLAFILLVVLLIQLIAFWVSRKIARDRK